MACGTQVLRYPKLDHLYAVSLLVSLPHNQARQLLVASRKLCKGYSKMMVRNEERGWEGEREGEEVEGVHIDMYVDILFNFSHSGVL